MSITISVIISIQYESYPKKSYTTENPAEVFVILIHLVRLIR
jgi:hypothetical protein